MAKIEVTSEVTGNVWKVQAKLGDVLVEEDVIMILESMKMEIPVEVPVEGTLVELLVRSSRSLKIRSKSGPWLARKNKVY
jgi:acetyl-CoA carboxylase biotin carboxyl carrier protein